MIISFILVFVFIGILGLIALGVMNLIFIVLGAVKASEGKLWEYPLCIKFFKPVSTGTQKKIEIEVESKDD